MLYGTVALNYQTRCFLSAAATFPWVFVKTDITHDAQHCCLACITLIFWVAINIRINCTKAKLVRASVPSLLWLPRQLSDRQA